MRTSTPFSLSERSAHGVTDDNSSPAVTETSSSEKDDTPKEDESAEEATARRAEAAKRFFESFSLWSLVDPSKPWVLVENGSFLGYFNWVPIHFRVGGWSVAALSYFTIIWYLCALAGAYFYSTISHPWWPSLEESGVEQTIANFTGTLEYPAAFTLPWFYNAATFGWMNYIIYLIFSSPNGARAWGTYTVQSWTLMTVRHGLCAVAPFYRPAIAVAEWIRFPVACSATITFTVWNFALMPFIYFFGHKTPLHRKRFLDFALSFRLINIHFMNIIFCVLGCGTWGGPSRRLEWVDFYVAVASFVVYMGWYLFVLDRLGIHLYPIFSPRTGLWSVLVVWSSLLGLYFFTVFVWQSYLMPPSSRSVTMLEI
jgi:hypothetical protein